MTAPRTSSTNDVNNAIPAYEVSAASPNVNATSPQVSTASFSDNDVYAFMIENPNDSNLLQTRLRRQNYKVDLGCNGFRSVKASLAKYEGKKVLSEDSKKIFINANDTAGFDKSKVECFNCHKMGHFARECRVPRNKEVVFISDMAKKGSDITFALMAFSDSGVYTDKTCLKNYETLKKQCDDLIIKLNQTEFTAATYKRGLAIVEEQLITYRKNEVLFSEEVAVLKREVACKDYEINVLINDSKENSDDSLIKEQVSKDTSSFVESSLNVDKETIFPVDKKVEFVKPKNHENQSFDHVPINCDHHQRKRIVYRNNYNRVDYDYYAKTTHPSVHRNMTPRVVLLKTGLTPLNTVRPVNTAHPKPAVHSAKSMSQFSKQAQSTAQRPFYKQTTLTRRSVHTAKRHYYTERPRAGNTARSYTGPVNAVRAKGGKPQQDDTGFVDSGCSRHMTGNIAYLSDFKEFDGGYVTFGGGAHGGRISGKQHRASCKTKAFNPITKPLFMLHMDLFGPTFVSSLMHKKYCLVVIDDYSIFSWVFFLTTKDETSEILKNFIKEVENLVDKRVKIIRSDNETEFKNKVMDDFCREKGIKREYSVARTPQQNGVAERKNRTLD
ncbi:putative ribonuclease H-like domain-containing protein [Tanacetum coccineum]